MKLKIKKNSIKILFPIIALMEPGLFVQISLIHNIWNGFRVMAILYIAIFIFKERELTTSTIQLLSMAFFLIPIVSAFINGGSFVRAVKAMLPIMALVIYFDAMIRKYKLYAVDLIANLMVVYIVINAICLIIFPNGFGAYIAEYTQTGADSRLNFLGKDNRFIYFFIFTIVICAVAKGIKSRITIWAILLSFFSMLFVWSGTGVIGIFLFSVYLLFVHGKKLDKAVKLIPLAVLFAVIFVSVVFFHIQEIFSDFIVLFLHKDPTFTGRTYLWARSLELIAQKPLLGYGVTETYFLERHGNYYSPHNLILQILLTGGYLQFGLFIALVIVAGSKLRDCKCTGMLSAGIFIYMICSLTEATMLNAQLYLLLSLAYHMESIQAEHADDLYSPYYTRRRYKIKKVMGAAR